MKVKQMNKYLKLDIGYWILEIPTRSQAGIVSQLLLLLLLVGGIGLGTYLVQQRTNLLPKAASSCDECFANWMELSKECDKGNIGNAAGYSDCVAQNLDIYSECSKQYCTEPAPEAADPPADRNAYCDTLDTDVEDFYYNEDTGNCDKNDQLPAPATDVPESVEFADRDAYCNRYDSEFYDYYYDKVTDACGKINDIRPPAPAAPQQGGWFTAQGDKKPNEGDKDCTTDQVQTCIDVYGIGAGCYKSSLDGFQKHCLYPAGTQSCIPEEGTRCTVQFKNDPSIKCSVIEREPKCNYPSGVTSCDSKDTTGCTNGCEVVQGNPNYSRCKAGPAAAAAAPGSTNAAAPAGNPQGAGGASGATGTSGGCGKNADGVEIPCFQIGSFDEATLLNTKAGASVASKNYQTYTDVLGKINAQIQDAQVKAATAKAQAAIDAGKGIAQACVSQ